MLRCVVTSNNSIKLVRAVCRDEVALCYEQSQLKDAQNSRIAPVHANASLRGLFRSD